ncbi:16S rRNA (cytidine(1402)-2'-O)-methyltransferase [Bacillaceae bacterium S4-13-58]
MVQIQKSFHHKQGALYLVPTPIGNLEDITIRAIQTLKDVDWIAAEDTRQTKKLTNYFEISTPLISYHEHNKQTKGEWLLEELRKEKKVAIVTDAGMPGISDPGYELVRDSISEGIPVIPLPGANAATTSLIASGLPTDHFYFFGFLPRKKKERQEELHNLKSLSCTLLFYESPHRLKDALEDLLQVLGDRKAVVARELTKRFEEFSRGNLSEQIAWAEEKPKGEFCILVEGSTKEEEAENDLWWSALSMIDHVEHYMEEKDIMSKEAIKMVAKDRNLPKREVYQAYHQIN